MTHGARPFVRLCSCASGHPACFWPCASCSVWSSVQPALDHSGGAGQPAAPSSSPTDADGSTAPARRQRHQPCVKRSSSPPVAPGQSCVGHTLTAAEFAACCSTYPGWQPAPALAVTTPSNSAQTFGSDYAIIVDCTLPQMVLSKKQRCHRWLVARSERGRRSQARRCAPLTHRRSADQRQHQHGQGA